jgi:hypothetical protein
MIATHESTYLDHLGRHVTDRIIPICVASPKVAKSGIVVTVASIMDCLHWQSWLAKLLATAIQDSHYCTCLGHLGQSYQIRNDPICVTPPKVAKSSTIVTVMCTDVYGHMSLLLALLC